MCVEMEPRGRKQRAASHPWTTLAVSIYVRCMGLSSASRRHADAFYLRGLFTPTTPCTPLRPLCTTRAPPVAILCHRVIHPLHLAWPRRLGFCKLVEDRAERALDRVRLSWGRRRRRRPVVDQRLGLGCRRRCRPPSLLFQPGESRFTRATTRAPVFLQRRVGAVHHPRRTRVCSILLLIVLRVQLESHLDLDHDQRFFWTLCFLERPWKLKRLIRPNRWGQSKLLGRACPGRGRLHWR